MTIAVEMAANGAAMTGMIPKWLPGGIFWVYLTGALLVLSAIAIIAHRQMKWAGILLALMLFGLILSSSIPKALASVWRTPCAACVGM